jgi:hypothetical protein
MKIQVLNDDGSVAFGYDTTMTTLQTFPATADKAAIANALHDATSFLGSEKHVITSIKGDIQSVVSRIETELGAHPAFTWAQTKLKNATAHLEAYVKGIWTEPAEANVAQDERGAAAAPASAPAAPPVPEIASAAAAQAATPAA